MKRLIFMLLFVVTIPVTCVHAQSEVGYADTLRITRNLREYMQLYDSGVFYYDSITHSFYTKQHADPLFLSDSSIYCTGKIVAWGNVVILEVHSNGDLWYMPSAFCHCLMCRKKNKLVWWGNINGKR